MKTVPNPVVSCSNVSLIPFLMRRLNLTHISFAFPYFSSHHLFLAFVQYDRTRHDRIPSQKLSSGGILPTSSEMFAVSSYVGISPSGWRLSHLRKIGPIQCNLPDFIQTTNNTNRSVVL